MKTRVLSGLVMVPLLAILYFGGYVLFAACPARTQVWMIREADSAAVHAIR